MFRVKAADLLTLPCLANHKVVAGTAGLNREVGACTVAEILDIGPWLRGKDFIHTTLSFMKDPLPDGALQAWLQGLLKAETAALAIKTKRYLDTIPEEILTFGDRYGVPIIELGGGTVQAQVNEEVLQLLLNAKSILLQYGQDALERLMSAALKGGLFAMTEVLYEMVGNPVLLETQDFRFITACGFSGGEHDPAMIARRSPEAIEEIRKKARAVVRSDSGMAFNIIKHSLVSGDKIWDQVIIPVVCSGKRYAFISVLESERSLTDHDYSVLKQACVVATLELYKDTSSLVEEQARRTFLNLLIEPDFHKEQALRHAAFLGFNAKTPVFAAVAHVAISGSGGNRLILDDAVMKQINSTLCFHEHDAFVVRLDDQLVILHHLPIKDIQIRSNRLAAFMQKAVEQLETHLRRIIGAAYPFFLGIGRPGVGLEHIRHTYEEACAALRMVEKFQLTGGTVFKYTDMGYYIMLDTLLANQDKAVCYCKDILGSILDADPRHRKEYFELLELYLQCNGNQAEIARRTSLHVNTVKYRLQKIGDFLRGELDDMNFRFSLWLALQARKSLTKDGLL